MRFYKTLPLFFILYAVQTWASTKEILEPDLDHPDITLETPQIFASKALGQILTTLDQRIDIDRKNFENIKTLSQQGNAKERASRLFEYLEIAGLKEFGESLLSGALSLTGINKENYESKLTHALADSCSEVIRGKIREYVTLSVKLRRAQQESNQEKIETLIKEMYVTYLKESKTTPHKHGESQKRPYFSIAWDGIFTMESPQESYLLFDLEIIKNVMNNHAMCSTEHDIVAITPSVFIYFQESILTTPERSKAIPKQDSIKRLMQERINIFNRHSETIAKLLSDQACAFLLNCGGILRSLQEACQDINRQIEEAYS